MYHRKFFTIKFPCLSGHSCRIKVGIVKNLPNNRIPTDKSSFSSDGKPDGKKPVVPPVKKYNEVRKNVKRYAFLRFMDYMTKFNFDKVLEKRFPLAVRVYRMFMDGAKEFYQDMKRFVKITGIANNSSIGLRALNRHELELYYQMPRDMMKVGPVLVASALPFTNYVILPVLYMFPKTFLSHHFWNLQQKAAFQEDVLRRRISCNRKVFRCMQANLEKLPSHDYQRLGHVLGLLGSGMHPTAEDIIEIKDIFQRSPFDLYSLTSKHCNYLCQLHDIGRGPWMRVRLEERSHIFHHMDLAIKREGGVHNMPMDALRTACFLRGLNPVNLTADDMVQWLREWVAVSIKVDRSNVSLFLHLPILIAYNHPNNWKLTHRH